MDELSRRQRAILTSNVDVWNYINTSDTRRLHESLATCVDDLMSHYPKRDKRESRIPVLAEWIRQFDGQVYNMANKVGLRETEFCRICAVATWGHEGKIPCQEPET